MTSIIVSEAHYKELLADREFLMALYDAGLDQWQGYDNAVDLFDGANKEETTIPALEDSSEIKYDSEGYRV